MKKSIIPSGKWLLVCLILVFFSSLAHAHRSGCHRWHSCPSDRGTYVCGDLGYCSQCPDNEYCEAGQPRVRAIIYQRNIQEKEYQLQIHQAQKQLKNMGFNPGPIDGDLGPLTKRALRQYQKKYALPVTGELDAATREALGIP